MGRAVSIAGVAGSRRWRSRSGATGSCRDAVRESRLLRRWTRSCGRRGPVLWIAEQGLDEQPAARSHDDDGCDPRRLARDSASGPAGSTRPARPPRHSPAPSMAGKADSTLAVRRRPLPMLGGASLTAMVKRLQAWAGGLNDGGHWWEAWGLTRRPGCLIGSGHDLHCSARPPHRRS